MSRSPIGMPRGPQGIALVSLNITKSVAVRVVKVAIAFFSSVVAALIKDEDPARVCSCASGDSESSISTSEWSCSSVVSTRDRLMGVRDSRQVVHCCVVVRGSMRLSGVAVRLAMKKSSMCLCVVGIKTLIEGSI